MSVTTRSRFTSALETLRESAVKLVEAADALLVIARDEKETALPEPAEEQPALSLPEVRALLARKSREGCTDGVRAIITARGVDRLSDIDPSEYAAIMKEAEALGDG